MFFPKGGGTIKGISKPGEIVWSRIFVAGGKLHADIGRGRSLSLPEADVERRWQITTPQGPVMNAVLDGITWNQFMGGHKANHIQVVCAPDAEAASAGLAAKAAVLDELGITVNICGSRT